MDTPKEYLHHIGNPKKYNGHMEKEDKNHPIKMTFINYFSL
jgi:hypothetical protein